MERKKKDTEDSKNGRNRDRVVVVVVVVVAVLVLWNNSRDNQFADTNRTKKRKEREEKENIKRSCKTRFCPSSQVPLSCSPPKNNNIIFSFSFCRSFSFSSRRIPSLGFTGYPPSLSLSKNTTLSRASDSIFHSNNAQDSNPASIHPPSPGGKSYTPTTKKTADHLLYRYSFLSFNPFRILHSSSRHSRQNHLSYAAQKRPLHTKEAQGQRSRFHRRWSERHDLFV